MHRYKVTMSRWNGGEREREVLFFDADAFEFLHGEGGPVVRFTTASGRGIGAVYGFDSIEMTQADEGPIRLPEARSTMAA